MCFECGGAQCVDCAPRTEGSASSTRAAFALTFVSLSLFAQGFVWLFPQVDRELDQAMFQRTNAQIQGGIGQSIAELAYLAAGVAFLAWFQQLVKRAIALGAHDITPA